MKKYYILFLFIFSIIGASAQDRYPDIRNFKTINKGSATLESKNPEYSQKKFMRGWHWDGNVYINDSLGSNHIDIGSMAFRDSIVHTRKIHNSMLTIQPDINPQSRCFSRANSHYDDEALFHFRSAQYEAGLKTDKKYNYLDYNDKEKPVFGFRYQDKYKIFKNN